MAKINFGAVATDARGKLKGVVYSKNRSGSYVRGKVTPVNPVSSYQQATRNTFSILSKNWSHLLTAAQRQSWVNFANLFPINDIFGNSIVLTGLNAYLKINARLQEAGATLLTTAPADQYVMTPLVDTLVATVAGSVMTFKQETVADAVTTYAYLYGAPAMPAGRNPQQSDYKLILVTAWAIAGVPVTENISAAFKARFGQWAIGQKISILAASLNSLNGALTPGTPMQAIST